MTSAELDAEVEEETNSQHTKIIIGNSKENEEKEPQSNNRKANSNSWLSSPFYNLYEKADRDSKARAPGAASRLSSARLD